jgi:hypothetical protein
LPLDRRKVWEGALELDDQIAQFIEAGVLFLISADKRVICPAVVVTMLPHVIDAFLLI